MPFRKGVPEPSPSDKARSAPITRRDESNLRFFAGFGSCDWNWHLNNGIYNTLADFSRIDLYIRSGLGDYMHRHKHITANGGVAFAYIKEIPLFTTFHVRSSFKAFDRKWFIAEHRFESRDGKRVYAIGHSRIVIKERSGKTIAPQKVLEEMRDLGILPGWAELSQKEITKDTPLNPPKIQDCCKAGEFRDRRQRVEHPKLTDRASNGRGKGARAPRSRGGIGTPGTGLGRWIGGWRYGTCLNFWYRGQGKPRTAEEFNRLRYYSYDKTKSSNLA